MSRSTNTGKSNQGSGPRHVDDLFVFGQPDEDTLAQIRRCADVPEARGAVLCADAHKGYSMPIGGVVAYRGATSPSGVGFDIGCGNKAVRTNVMAADIRNDLPELMDLIAREIRFGIGGTSGDHADHAIFDDSAWDVHPGVKALKPVAREQLGTVGAGNHYINLMEDEETGALWVAVHFGSRGFGHRTASGFLNLAHGRPFDARLPHESMDAPPTLLRLNTEVGQAYHKAMQLAGRYAYAGRDAVVSDVLGIIGAEATFEVHNHHNFAWEETHGGEKVIVVRKGATPCHPGQISFVGGSMADISVVIQGKDTPAARKALYSTIHGAGRVMSRTQAAGKWRRVRGRRQRVGGAISVEDMRRQVKRYGVELRGGGADEAPGVYRKLRDVVAAHLDTVDVLHTLKPIGVAMAPSGARD